MKTSDALAAARQRFADFQKHRKAFHPGRSWFRLETDESSAKVFIYDAIGFFGVEAEQFIREIEALDVGRIDLHINSPGGDVFGGTAIYNALLRHKAKVHVKIDGLAASMASVIALAGDTVEMAENAFFMIHKPWVLMLGNADDLRHEADVLDKIEASAVGIYVRSSNLSDEEVREAMAAETWYSAEEAKDAGFVDTIYTGEGESAGFDLSVFAHAPGQLASDAPRDREPPSAKEIETALREAGLSRDQAKGLLSKGLKAIQREAGPEGAPSQREVDDGDRDAAIQLIEELTAAFKAG